MDSIRKGVHLKKATPPNTSSSTQPTRFICETDDDYNRLLSETSFDAYYHTIEDLTFRSTTIELSCEEASAILSEHDLYKAFMKREGDDLYSDMDIVAEYDEWRKPTVEHVHRHLLLTLAERIDKALPLLNSSGFFCRLATMSPKDAATNRIGFVNSIRLHLEEIVKMENELNVDFKTEMNRRLYALYMASTSILSLSNGMQAVQLLIESGRAHQELTKIASGVYNKGNMSNGLVLREFNKFDVAMELRAFVYNRKLTGISQYNQLLYFPHLIKKRDEITKSVSTFLSEKVLNNPKIETPNFIVDLVLTVDESSKELKVKIVELNPLAEFAGTCLFTWEYDRHILTGDGSHVEFRVVTEVDATAGNEMGSEWKMALQKLDNMLHQ